MLTCVALPNSIQSMCLQEYIVCPTKLKHPISQIPGVVCRDVTVLVLDRPRHDQIIKEVREAGARIKLISDGDVGGAIEVAKPSAPVDVLFGIGGTPEGIICIERKYDIHHIVQQNR